MRVSMDSWATAAVAGLLSVPLASALYQNGSVIAPCDSPIYCYGDLLREIELARPFADSKTFVDLPTTRPLNEVLDAFSKLEKPIKNNTALHDFLSEYFGQAGSELQAVPTNQLDTQPDFLDAVNSSEVSAFVSQVIDIWPELTRRYVGAGNCTDCVDSFIPINRTFVVAGGRFREPYYWDSFWIIEGLLRTKGSFTQIAENIIENFLDLVEEFGFVPNGARRYYLNRSQPPLLTQMVKIYVEYTQNYTLLERALPLLEKEYDFWGKNRTVTLERAGRNYTLNNYEVSNTQPRPESYYEDYVTANNQSYYNEEGKIFNATVSLNETERATLYSNLASGAESGWDYSSRWLANPNDAVSDTFFPLRSLNTINTIPVDLNSILYANEITLASFHQRTGNFSAAKSWADRAAARSAAMTALLWDEEHYSYFDYNLTSGAKNIYYTTDNTTVRDDLTGAPTGSQVIFNPAQFYPFWTGAAPASIKNDPSSIRRVYTRVAELLENRDGAIAASNLRTGQQWDEPNVWPPLEYIIIEGLRNVPVASSSSSSSSTSPSSLSADPNNQTTTTTTDDYIWTQSLALSLAQRYLDSTYCTWQATASKASNSTSSSSSSSSKNATQGIMFEKYSDVSTDAAGGGGEYAVVEGFGWTNGVLIWAADVFGDGLVTPSCREASGGGDKRRKRSAVEVDAWDRVWVKGFRT
ncbi:glycoside hydrolase family 37 protein [Periconia macrospinosa]|uniref:Trehalase n=1 Tax=Periconia macrospinosa TaxID=97972 RepID=A0A2V1DJJ8_9PLEO|nr:glycoside hydrolase family 37 protein [Periconia macrospinosa]